MSSGKTLLVLAHPDDEVLFWPLIARTPADKLALAYVTDGSAGGACRPEARVGETRRMLASLGSPSTAAAFLGQASGLPDGVLHLHLDQAWTALAAWAEGLGPVARIYTHAWEGGHQDHDACHALALALADKTGAARAGQVACYRRPDGGFAPYSLLDPIAANGAPDRLIMTGAERRAMASCIWRYPSQWKSWVGLGPPLLTRLALDATFPLQPVSRTRIDERPHAGPLLYEARGGPSFADVSEAARTFLKRGNKLS